MSEREAPRFPFSAIVGNEQLKQALLLNAVDPRIGGVVIRGDRGTAKSTVVRALAALLPSIATREGCPVGCDPTRGHCEICGDVGDSVERPARIVELPLGSTEDRVVGSIDIAHALSSGERRFEAGLLAAANRGVLYIDEVNLLPDHLVDLLLDVAASGVNVVERDGTSISHAAEFVLVGTMNPDEGELRPQLLDRFGLVVDVRTPTDIEVRAEVVRRRIAYDRDPAAFSEGFGAAERATREALVRARLALPRTSVPESMVRLAVELCVEARADGLRADITLYRAASALAALGARSEVSEADVFDAALLVLPHRQRRTAPGEPDAPSVAELVAAHRGAEPGNEDGEGEDDGGSGAERPRPPRPSDAGPDARDGSSDPDGTRGEATHLRVVAALDRPVPVPQPDSKVRSGEARAHSGATAEQSHGRVVGSRRWDGRGGQVALVPTVLAATRRRVAGRLRVVASDLRVHRRQATGRRLVLLLVDGSGSMGAQERIARTKAALRTMIERVYVRRERIAMQVFRGGRAQLLVPPGKDFGAARAAVEALPTGGGTPLDAALRGALAVLRRDERTHAGEGRSLVLVTDGRTREDARAAAAAVASVATDVLVLDTEVGPSRLGRARQLAGWMGASYEVLP